MPGVFAALDQNLPRFTGKENLERRVQLLQDYQYQLLEQLRYILSHLDMRCFNQTALKEWEGSVTGEIYKRIEDAEGNLAELTITAAGIKSQVSDNAGNISTLQQTATELSSQISNAQGDISTLKQTAVSLTSQISSAQGDISTLQQTAASLSSQISNAQGDISTLRQTAASLSSQISNAQGDISSLRQTATSLSSQISNAQGDLSSLRQSVDSIDLTVVNQEGFSTISLTKDGITAASRNIEFLGMVGFSDLSGEGKSSINGANINTGTINAGNVNVTDEFALWQSGFRVGFMGCGYGYDGERNTWGAKLSDGSGQNYLLAADSGVRMQDNYGGAIWVTGGNCFSSVDMMTYSDRRLKEDIDHDLACYQKFFRALRPCRFLLKNNPMEGYHTGFIAQEVEEAMDAANLSPMDFTGLGRVRLPDGAEVYALRYGAFTALNTYMIQVLDRRVEELERILKEGNGYGEHQKTP